MRVMNQMTRTVVVLAIAAAPTFAFAQSPKAAAQPNPAADHLSAARSALNKVLNAPAPSGDAFKKLADLKTHYLALEKAASTASPEWKTHYQEIDRLAGELLAAPAPDTPVGTSGREGETPSKGLDPAVAANLKEFRSHMNAFSAAMSGVTATAPSASSAPAPAPASATPAPAPAAPAPAPAAPAPAPASATPAPAPAAAPATPTPAPAPAATPATTTSGSASPTAATAPPSADTNVAAQVGQVIALIDAALAANAQQTMISIDRAMLEHMKTELAQIKQRVEK